MYTLFSIDHAIVRIRVGYMLSVMCVLTHSSQWTLNLLK